MRAIERVLVAVDFSPASDAALHCAAQVAEQLGAEVELLHVGESRGVPWQNALVAISIPPDELAEHLATTGADLSALLESLERHGRVRSNRRTVDSLPRSIVGCAIEEGVDLIVMGTGGRKGLDRLLNPSVAEEVVRTAPCPVLVVRTPEAAVGHAAEVRR